MSSGGGSGPPRAAALPTAKTLSPVARRRLGKELDEWLSAEPPVPGMSVSATERLDLYVGFPPFLLFVGALCDLSTTELGQRPCPFLFHRVLVLRGAGR